MATDDGEWAIIRLAEMKRELKDFQIPPRWSDYLNHGFGYPLFLFTYPLPYYLAAAISFMGAGLITSIKILFVSSALISVIFMFLLGKSIVDEYAGLIAAIFYMVAPYRMVDMYIRGAIGELLSMALFPVMCYTTVKFVASPSLLKFVTGAILVGVLITTHNVMALIFFPLWLIFFYINIFSYKEDVIRNTWHRILPMLILGLGLSAYFFVPALLEKKNIVLSSVKLAQVEENFIKPLDFIQNSSPASTEVNFNLGWIQIAAVLMSIVSFIISGKIQRAKYQYYFYGLLIFILGLVFLSTSPSKPLWDITPLVWLDFPWRLLAPMVFFLSLFTIFLSLHQVLRWIGLLLAAGVIILNMKLINPTRAVVRTDSYYATNDATTTSRDELLPIWVKIKPTNRYGSKVQPVVGDTQITNLIYDSKSIRFEAYAQTDSRVQINTIYYPGWQFEIDSQASPISYDNPQGLMQLNLPSGKHDVHGKFSETPIRLAADLISLVSLAIIVTLLIYSIRLRFF